VQSKWNEVKTLVPQRDQTLQDELKKQQNNEALRRQFAEKSNQVEHVLLYCILIVKGLVLYLL
jgi:hypothetical protein